MQKKYFASSVHSNQFRIVVLPHECFRQAFNDFYQQKQCTIAKSLIVISFRDLKLPEKRLIIQSINIVMNIKSTQNT